MHLQNLPFLAVKILRLTSWLELCASEAAFSILTFCSLHYFFTRMIVKNAEHVEKEGSSSRIGTRDTNEESGNAEKSILQVRLAKAGKVLAKAEEKAGSQIPVCGTAVGGRY
jgi:hypothetical protein